MITLITGAPGAGKTNALVSLLSELAEGRALYVSGIPDLKVPHVELEDPTQWHQVVEDGAAVVIDEVQRVWRPNRTKITDDIAALETHRHRGIDFFIVTQGPNLVHQNVRALVGRHVHLRDTGMLGRWWYEWPECADNVTVAWKNAPIKKQYRLDKGAQALYTSASKHVKPIRSVPRSLILLGVVLVAFLGLGWNTYGRFSSKFSAPTASAATPPAGPASAVGMSGAARPDQAPPRYEAGAASAPLTAASAEPAKLAGCVVMRNRCECLDTAGLVMTVEINRCRLNAMRTGADLAYSYPRAEQVRDYLKHVEDVNQPDQHATQTAALSPRAK